MTAGDTRVVAFSLTAGNEGDAPAGRLLLETIGKLDETVKLLMDRAYEDDKTRLTAWGLQFDPVVPPHNHWNCKRALSRRGKVKPTVA